MRTSGQLTKQYSCGKNTQPNMSIRSNQIVNAMAQKNVLKQVMEGFIPNETEAIEDELTSLYESKEIVFETRYQGKEVIQQAARRIKRYVDYEQREVIYPEKEDITKENSKLLLPNKAGELENTDINYYGEQIRVIPDYITKNGHEITIVKVHTGRAKKSSNEALETNEVEALGKLGEKLYPGDRIRVTINYLGDNTGELERVSFSNDLPYNPSDEAIKNVLHKTLNSYPKKSRTLEYDEKAKEFFEEKHKLEEEIGEEMEEHDCEGCAKYNICHYTEPPIAKESESAVRPMGEIRLTPSQREAIEYRHGIARINAGAGAGKTLVVAWRIKELLKEGVKPEELCLVTFTKAGAEEMTARVKTYSAFDGVEVDWEKFTSTTFNSLCQKIIDDHYIELGYSKAPRIIPEEVKADRINTILGKYPRISGWKYGFNNSTSKNFYVKTALQSAEEIFGVIKKEGMTIRDNPINNPTGEWDIETVKKFKKSIEKNEDIEIVFQMYEEYEEVLKRENRIEYDDQIKLVERLSEIRPRLFDEIGFKHIIVDEFQDTDLPQIKLLQKMKDGSNFESLMCVGDDSQSIFGFRNTSPEYMINFGKYLGDGNEVTGYRFDDYYLMENHRSTADIIEFANKVNELNPNRVEKDLIATKEAGQGVIVNGFYSEKEEYKNVAEKIKREIEEGKEPCDIAFLASDKYQLQKMADELTKLGIPSILMNPIPYLQNSRCAAITTFFDSYAYKTTQGYMDYLNALEHGDLAKANDAIIDERVKAFAEETNGQEPSYKIFMEYVKQLDPEGKDECFKSFIENKLELCESVEELKDLFRTIKLYGQNSCFKREGRYDGVCLTTIHSAKGLEWESVYYTVDKLDREPLHRGFNNAIKQLQKEELLRQWFVAASRARSHCECVGQYALKATREEVILNNFLKEAYKIVGKEYDFHSQVLWETRAIEKREEREESIIRAVPHLYQPTSTRESIRQAINQGNRSRELTAEERREYDELTAGAEQLTIETLLTQ